jgi:aspartate racemase
MKTIGLVGGMSWESTLTYYRLLNEEVARRLGGLHSAQCLLFSVDFAGIEALQRQDRWEEATACMIEAARSLERGGADCILICTNTMHISADAVQGHVSIPLLHIADVTCDCVVAHGLHRVGLLGTRFTMEQDFYRDRLARGRRLEVLVPESAADRQTVHDVIYDELCLGVVNAASREAYKRIIAGLVARGAEGIVLGCTEIMLLIGQGDCDVPVFDTTSIHAHAAVDFALA